MFYSCERGDSNPHSVKNWILNPACLPIPPLSHLPDKLCPFYEKGNVFLISISLNHFKSWSFIEFGQVKTCHDYVPSSCRMTILNLFGDENL